MSRNQHTKNISPRGGAPKASDYTETLNEAPLVNIAPDADSLATVYRRSHTGKAKVFSDLFKLKPAKVLKQIGLAEHPEADQQSFHAFEHTHLYATRDRKGKEIFYSIPIGGHFHVIEIEPSKDPNVPPKVLSVSGPMVMQKVKKYGKIITTPVPANDYDEHTHEVEYLRTDEVLTSITNVHAAAVVAQVEMKTAPLAGVQG